MSGDGAFRAGEPSPLKIVDGQRATEEISLKRSATEAQEAVALLFCLDAFRDDQESHCLAQGDDGLSDGAAAVFAKNVVNERAVDLELVERQAFEVGQRRIA